ncbi:WD repeat-containing protein 41 [Tupaia chinensis]|uniref:WD repeat-containing protein 41 n=1 Tax=Tupaia chinensis TaxID=246437 RepID=L9L4S4_TUPCH|nr:WD repeat-containing protein 41 [Tupaia chinensis]
MLRWLIGGGREPQGLAETIGEEQTQNPYTELLVLKAHHDIVRFLVQLDDYRFASAGDDGIVIVWNAQCLTILQRLDVWLSGGNEVCVWNRKLDLLCKTCHLSDTVIFRLVAPTDESLEWDIREVKRLLDHQDNILSLVNVNDLSFVTGSHVGELIIWDALDWTMQAYERNFWDPAPQLDTQQEIKLCQKLTDISIHHFTCDEENVFAAVGRGLYVYSLQMKRVIACQKTAHDSSVLHIAKLPNRQLISCSEDGSVRIWELREKQQLAAEPVPTGFFNMWGFGRVNKQANQPVKKQQENVTSCSLELIGDLIGHSSSVEMFLYFEDHGLVTCSADHLIILWKNGERESGLRSLKLFQKLEENGDLYFTV